jgi:hypothetical protein
MKLLRNSFAEGGRIPGGLPRVGFFLLALTGSATTSSGIDAGAYTLKPQLAAQGM